MHVVSRETLRIDLTLAALNKFSLKLTDIQNAYITAPFTEKKWKILAQGFGKDAGRKSILVRDLYGFKIAGSAFRNHFADFIHCFGLFPCPADLDIWIKPTVRPEDGFEYYAYVIIYMDDVMVIHNKAESVFRRIDSYFKLNPSLIGDPGIYLEAKLK